MTSSDQPTDALEFGLSHLQAELARVELLLRGGALRQALQDSQANPGVQLAPGDFVVAGWPAQVRYLWQEAPASVIAQDPAWVDAYILAVQRSTQAALQAQRAGYTSRLQQLATAFDLDAFDLDLLLLALLPALDPAIGRIFVYLQDDGALTYPTVKLTLDVLCDTADPLRLTRLSHFAPDAPLLRHGLLALGGEPRPLPTPLLSQGLGVDPAVVAWLLGRYQPHAALGAYVKLVAPQVDAADELLAAEVWAQLASPGPDPAVLAFYGSDQESQAAAARLFAGQRGQPLLTVDLPALLKAGTAPALAVRFALRDARLTGAIPYLVDLDVCLEQGSLPDSLLAILAEHPSPVITSTASRWHAGKELAERPIVHQAFSVPAYAQRHALWMHYLGEAAGNEVNVAALASQFALDSGRIRAVAAAAKLAAWRRGDHELRDDDLFAAARDYSSTRLGDLAHKVRPRQGWGDLVLPAEKMAMLREMAAMVRGRPKVLDQWGVAEKLVPSRAVTALFAGEPGTGKTMAAEVIAGDLGLDLYKINLSSLVDKYIGETEKNLERIFVEAESANAILFFDEADAIFGKRTGVRDAHDRYANVGVSYLLQRMESFDGITILATNLQANLDEAFTRRLHFVVDFPFPGAEERLGIWQALFPPGVPRAADLDLEWLAQRFKLAGGSIRNIIVSAAYSAADAGEPVTMNHLLHGAQRELQKMGRLLVGEADDLARHVETQKAHQANERAGVDTKKVHFYRIRPSS